MFMRNLTRALSALLVVVLLAALVTPAFAQAGTRAIVHTGKLNVRTGPSIAYPIVTKLDLRTEVILLGRAEGTTWVQVQTPGGAQGWANSIYLQLFTSLDTLPITWNSAIPTPVPQQPPPAPGPTVYVVQAGDTLQNIAARYGTTWQILAAVNNIVNPNRVFAGQRIVIAYSMPAPQPQPQPQPQPGGNVYVVQAGDELRTIAARFGTTWQAIAAANNLPNANFIYPGQRLVIPVARPAQTYVVQRGDTLFSIALRYGTTVQVIQTANNLPNPNAIFAGQRLVIP
ncbi:MAG TPA: LysM peptidoglycan-binding domain-containing protein [Aggregatilineales bacterium]|nr:LysM peptidoglycan-binding domain-containing protein [Aggregatilineales bacterium]